MIGEQVDVRSVDKFPRMTDYVVPGGVRIGDADRVRLGAHLAEGTTIMHEGFVNFNAGTLGHSMVEGRISAGVVVGDGSMLAAVPQSWAPYRVVVKRLSKLVNEVCWGKQWIGYQSGR